MNIRKTFDAITKEINDLDRKKRQLMIQIKEYPEYAIGFIQKSIKLNPNKWYVRTDAKGNPMDISDGSKVFRYTQFRVNNTVHKQTVYLVYMTLEFMNGSTREITIDVSINRPIEPQILSNMIELTPDQLKDIEYELKRRKEEQEKIKKIKELEDLIKKASDELNKLKA